MLTKTITVTVPIQIWKNIREDAARRRIPMTRALLKGAQPYTDGLEHARVNDDSRPAADIPPENRAG